MRRPLRESSALGSRRPLGRARLLALWQARHRARGSMGRGAVPLASDAHGTQREQTSIDEKLNRLIDTLNSKTESGKLSWEETAADSEFLANFSAYGVSIAKKSYPTNPPDYTLTLLNSEGEDMETSREADPSRSKYRELQRLFTLARRSARNVNEGLDAILKILEE